MEKQELIEYLTDVRALENDLYTLQESVSLLQARMPVQQKVSKGAEPVRAAVDKPVLRERSGEGCFADICGLVGFIGGCISCIGAAHWIDWFVAPIPMALLFYFGGKGLAYLFDNPEKSNRLAEERYRQQVQQAERDYQQAVAQREAAYRNALNQSNVSYIAKVEPLVRQQQAIKKPSPARKRCAKSSMIWMSSTRNTARSFPSPCFWNI